MDNISLLEKSIAEKPIRLPENRYLAAIKDFGVDEILAGGIDVVATTMVGAMVAEPLRSTMLPFVGPIMEKGMFFPQHLYKAWKIYSTLPKKKREQDGFSHYLKTALHEGMENLAIDVTVHDPLYIGFMWAGLHYMPELPPAVLSASSYITAAAIAACIKVGKGELAYHRKKKLLESLGFESESYFESRFFILNEKNPRDMLEGFAKEFDLHTLATTKYEDVYLENKFPHYNGRTPKVRFRKREMRPEEKSYPGNQNREHMQSLQITFTKPNEVRGKEDQCRYFPIKKDKFYYFVDGEMPWSIDALPDEKVRNAIATSVFPNQDTCVTFSRTSVRNEKSLLLCTDDLHNYRRPFYVVEIKSHNDTKLLQQAMRYLMVECPIVAVETTLSKKELYETA